MKAGFSAKDITPPIGMEMPGGYGKVYNTGVHNPLKARAAVFEADGQTVAFVGVDSCELPIYNKLHQLVRQEVEARTGIPGQKVMVGVSQTHSGGPLSGLLPAEYADAPPLVFELLDKHTPTVDPQFHEWVIRQIVSAVCEAHRQRQEATLSVGRGAEDQVSFNRRFKMRNGRVFTHPGKGNPDILEPAGPVDPEVGVVAAWNSRGDLLGCIVNFGCHCTTFGGTLVSADYVYSLEQTIQGVMGGQAVVVFLGGASGDVTQINNQSLRAREFGEKASRTVGMRVGAEAIKVMASAEPGDLSPLGAANTVLPIPRRRPSRERLARCQEIVAAGLANGVRDTTWTFAKEILILEYLIQLEPIAPVEVQALQVGPAIFLANPSEYFAESGLAIKKASPFPFTFVVTVANGTVGYVPPASAFKPDGGGYETILTSISNLPIEAADQIAAASLELAGRFTPGAVPQAPVLAEPAQPWSYGILGPDVD